MKKLVEAVGVARGHVGRTPGMRDALAGAAAVAVATITFGTLFGVAPALLAFWGGTLVVLLVLQRRHGIPDWVGRPGIALRRRPATWAGSVVDAGPPADAGTATAQAAASPPMPAPSMARAAAKRQPEPA